MKDTHFSGMTNIHHQKYISLDDKQKIKQKLFMSYPTWQQFVKNKFSENEKKQHLSITHSNIN